MYWGSLYWPWVAVAWACFYLNLYIYWDCQSQSSASLLPIHLFACYNFFFCFWLWQTWGQIKKENDLHWPLPTLTWFEQILLLTLFAAAYKSFTGLFDSALVPLQTMVTDDRQDSSTNPLLILCFLVIAHTLYIVVARDAQCHQNQNVIKCLHAQYTVHIAENFLNSDTFTIHPSIQNLSDNILGGRHPWSC